MATDCWLFCCQLSPCYISSAVGSVGGTWRSKRRTTQNWIHRPHSSGHCHRYSFLTYDQSDIWSKHQIGASPHQTDETQCGLSVDKNKGAFYGGDIYWPTGLDVARIRSVRFGSGCWKGNVGQEKNFLWRFCWFTFLLPLCIHTYTPDIQTQQTN